MILGTPDFDDLLRDILVREKRHPLYHKTVKCAERMSVHIYGEKPTEILDRVRPREPDEIKSYRKENYEPTTKATASKALSVISKIFNPSLYQIKWKDQSNSGAELERYTLEYFPKHNSIIKFLSQAGLKRMIADPNGVFTVRPAYTPQSSLERVEPTIKIYGSENIWYYDDDHFLIFKRDEERKGGGKIYHFEYYDKTQVAELEAEVITQQRITVTITMSYNHGFDEIPVWFLTGETETEDNGDEYYVSFFEPAIPFWNKAIMHESDLDAAFIMHLHPQKVVVAEECDFIDQDVNQRCMNGQIALGDGSYRICPSCKGTGKRIPVGPYGIHMVTKDKLSEGAPMNVPVQYVTVPTDPTKMLKERVDEQHRKGLEALNMDILDRVGENQSGIAKVIDRGELYDFLYKISDVVFDTHLQNFFYFFNLYMFGVQDKNPGRSLDKNLPEIQKPVMFDLSSAGEMTLEYAEAKKASINPEFLRQKQIAIAAKEYGNNPEIKRKVIVKLELDPLPEISPADMDLKLAGGTISRRDAVIHDNLGTFVERAEQDYKDFYSLPKVEKLDIIRKYADEFIIQNRVTLTVPDDTEEISGEN
jgi:hypothetical protein